MIDRIVGFFVKGDVLHNDVWIHQLTLLFIFALDAEILLRKLILIESFIRTHGLRSFPDW